MPAGEHAAAERPERAEAGVAGEGDAMPLPPLGLAGGGVAGSGADPCSSCPFLRQLEIFSACQGSGRCQSAECGAAPARAPPPPHGPLATPRSCDEKAPGERHAKRAEPASPAYSSAACCACNRRVVAHLCTQDLLSQRYH